MNLEGVRRSVRERTISIQITPHADIERRKDGLEIGDLESAVLQGEKIEDYGDRVLLLSFTETDQLPVHTVIEHFEGSQVVVIVTCYIPESGTWEKGWKKPKPKRKGTRDEK